MIKVGAIIIKYHSFLLIIVLFLTSCSPRILERKEIPSPRDGIKRESIQYVSQGISVRGYILQPESDTKSLPVIIYIRGGHSKLGFISEEFFDYLAFISSLGYAVFINEQRGATFTDGKDEYGGKEINDVKALIRIALKEKNIDKNKIYMWGNSRGGMMAYLFQKYQLPIKAMAVTGGISDLSFSYSNREKSFQDVLDDAIGGPPAKYPKDYQSRSAVCWPEKFHIPVIIIHGEDDWRVPVSQVSNLVTKLENLSKEFEVHILPDQPHFTDTNISIPLIKGWFEKY